MFKDSLVLTNKSWGVRNTDFVFDILYVALFSIILGISFASNPHYFGFGFMAIFLPTLVYGILLKKYDIYVYWIGIFAQTLLVALVIPVSFYNPYVLFTLSSLSWGFVFTLKKYTGLNIPYFLFFILMGMGLYSFIPQWKGEEEAKLWFLDRLSNWVFIPGLFGKDVSSIWEILSVYAMMILSIAVFRRYTVWILLLIFSIIVYIFFFPTELIETLPIIISYTGIFFIAYLIPGRNHYASFWASVVSCLIVGMAVCFFRFVVEWSYSFIFVIILFFMVESFLLKYFLVNRQRVRSDL